MESREIIRINAAGTAGADGSGPDNYGFRPLEAKLGYHGLHGQSARHATVGNPGSNINIRLGYDENDPAIVQVAGEGRWSGQLWKISHDKELLLDCKGGDGGRGGRGEDGQQGGQGSTGRNATKYQDAEDGGIGGTGGDGGQGTNGADGADAGSVFITVGEDDLDLLIACTWDTAGGKGGASGTHGMPGDGGIGGTGGNGCTWTERHGDTTIKCSRPPGRAGNQGRPGSQPGSYVTGGAHGKPGSTQIRVLKKDLTEATYPDRYRLKVVSFDVFDENDDGVNEPGEYLIVKNVKVENEGKMPSPGSANPIQLLIHGTQWLQPVESEPIHVPCSILPGDTVEVPGILRAYIRNETITRTAGQPLRAKDQVKLIATFSQRLNRTLPEFSDSVDFKIEYPLELTAPGCLECVQKGDRVRFSWTVRNNSRKPYGMDGILGRYTATAFVDPGRIFELPYSDHEQGKHEAIDAIDELEPGQEVPIEQDFIVSATTMEYSDASLQVTLILADPHTKEPDGSSKKRAVAWYNINLQIAGAYQHDPFSRYLLVVNSKTPNSAIHEMIGFIRLELRLGLDIFNLSLTGSYIDSKTQRSVLEGYKEKSIIVYGNDFPCLATKRSQSPWELMDSWEVCSLAKGGTSFLFYNVDNKQTLSQWSEHLVFSAKTSNKEFVSSGFVGDFVNKIQSEDQTKYSSEINMSTIQTKLSGFKSAFSCCMSTTADEHALKVANKLTKAMPLRRFIATPDLTSDDPFLPNIVLIEGIPKTSTIIASISAPVKSFDRLKYAIVSILPTKSLATLFWNSWGSSQIDARNFQRFSVSALYKGTGWQETQGLVWADSTLEIKILQLICLAIEWQIGTEIGKFLEGKAPAQNSLLQLPILSHFLSVPQGDCPIQELKEQDIVLSTLGVILGDLVNIGFTQFFSHKVFGTSSKRKLHDQVSIRISEALSHMCAPTLAAIALETVRTKALATKQEIKSLGGEDIGPLLMRRITELTQTNVRFVDLTALQLGSIAVTTTGLRTMVEEYGTRSTARDNKAAASLEVLKRHINPIVEEQEISESLVSELAG